MPNVLSVFTCLLICGWICLVREAFLSRTKACINHSEMAFPSSETQLELWKIRLRNVSETLPKGQSDGKRQADTIKECETKHYKVCISLTFLRYIFFCHRMYAECSKGQCPLVCGMRLSTWAWPITAQKRAQVWAATSADEIYCCEFYMYVKEQ